MKKTDVSEFVTTKLDGDSNAYMLRELLRVPVALRLIPWLRRALQAAIELELATLPPYLTAYWSLKQTAATNQARRRLLAIAIDEMGHMGLACNLLVAFGGTPRIADQSVVPVYPGELPFRIKPGLVIPLQRFSRDSLEVFMRIEEPYSGDVCWHCGESYPTIGKFYSAVYEAIRRLKPCPIKKTGQLEDEDVGLTKITSKRTALTAIKRIQDEGEGTSTSPIPDPDTGDLAHFFSFGELYHEGELKPDGSGGWKYEPQTFPLPMPPELDIHQIAMIPSGGYPSVSRDFDDSYSAMLKLLQSAWDHGSQDILLQAVAVMIDDLGRKALALMESPIPTKPDEFYGPSFLFYP
jgi:hypothetical protein